MMAVFLGNKKSSLLWKLNKIHTNEKINHQKLTYMVNELWSRMRYVLQVWTLSSVCMISPSAVRNHKTQINSEAREKTTVGIIIKQRKKYKISKIHSERIMYIWYWFLSPLISSGLTHSKTECIFNMKMLGLGRMNKWHSHAYHWPMTESFGENLYIKTAHKKFNSIE